MAEKKAEKADLVVKCPLAIITGKDGRLHHLYKGAFVARDAFDEGHLKQLEDEDAVGAPDSE